MPERRFFGWRPSIPDIRDVFLDRRIVGALPPTVDNSVPKLSAPFEPPFNQGQLGSCGPNSAAGDIVFAALRQQKLPSCPMPSRLFIYYITRWMMGTINSDSGVSNRDMCKALANYGWCDETLWPYDVSKYTQRPPANCFNQALTRKITQYLAVRQVIDQMKDCLANGDPIIFGFTVYANMETPAVDATGIVPMPGGAQIGGHDVHIIGFSDVDMPGVNPGNRWPAGHFKFKNSWGPNWGDSGMGYIAYNYAANPQLAGDFWTIKHSALPDPTPNPPDPPTAIYIDVPVAGRYVLTPTK